MRQKVSDPTKGSSMILNARTDSGSSSEARRTTGSSVLKSMAGGGGGFHRGGRGVDHRVEQRLDALVLEGRAREDRIEGAGQHGLAQALLDDVDRRLLARQI